MRPMLLSFELFFGRMLYWKTFLYLATNLNRLDNRMLYKECLCGKGSPNNAISALCGFHLEVLRCPNVSTTPLRQLGFWQCLHFSWTTLRGKHCRHPIAVMGVVDTFGQYSIVQCSARLFNQITGFSHPLP